MDLDKLQQELAEDEGCKYEIYNDHLGYATFGIGHLVTDSDLEYGQEIGTKVSKVTGKEFPIYSDPKITGDMPTGMKPTGVAGDIQEIYRTGDPATVRQRVEEFKDRLRRQQGG